MNDTGRQGKGRGLGEKQQQLNYISAFFVVAFFGYKKNSKMLTNEKNMIDIYI
jgi:hypothetical protein